jgi:hypothetical protein
VKRPKVRLTQTSGPKSPAPNAAAEVNPLDSGIPRSGDHRGWALWWGNQALRSIKNASDPNGSAQFLELDTRHAVRAARFAFWHAATVKGYKYWDERSRAAKTK